MTQVVTSRFQCAVWTGLYFPYLLNPMLLITFWIGSDESKEFVIHVDILDGWICMELKNIHNFAM